MGCVCAARTMFAQHVRLVDVLTHLIDSADLGAYKGKALTDNYQSQQRTSGRCTASMSAPLPSLAPTPADASSPAAALTLAVFVLSIVLVLLTMTFPKIMRVPFWLFPLIGCCVLLAAQAVPPSTIWQGAIVGDNNVQPFAILIIFFSLAYMCLSLDASGGLGLLSQSLINQARGSWLRLFSIVGVLSIVLTVTTSNVVF